jgi:alanine-synthesizing transaminase
VGLSPTWAELQPLLDHPAVADYDPQPLGHFAARAAVAALHGAQADQVVLAASTSEAYSWALKLVCDPGDEVLVPQPCYPLLDYLAGLDGIRLVPYPCRAVGGEWPIDRDAMLANCSPRTRAVVVVTPANPTGAVLQGDEALWLQELCAARGLALLRDEVFADTLGLDKGTIDIYQSDTRPAPPCLTVVLSGLSKTCLLPQLKAGWMVVTGPTELQHEAMSRLEVIADTWLSVATPVQLALPQLLGLRPVLQERLMARLRHNRSVLRAALAGGPASLLPAAGGWSAVLRVPQSWSDEERALDLLATEGLVVQPGWLYDLPGEGWLVLGCLQPEAVFGDAAERLARRLLAQG